ncbi:Uncharacterised protein [uncultured archaeon]|nr:Uncharacterised protein [uncultured archaeon]
MYRASYLMILVVSAMVLFTVSAYAVQENNTTAKEIIPALNNTTTNNTDNNITSTNFTAINNTVAIKTAVSENIAAKNNTSMNSTAFNADNATAKENNPSIEQRSTSMRELHENESKSGYDIDKYSTIKPTYNVSAYSNIKGLSHVGGNSESSTFSIGTTPKPGLDISKNASSVHTFELSLPAKPIIETSKFPFMCNIV